MAGWGQAPWDTHGWIGFHGFRGHAVLVFLRRAFLYSLQCLVGLGVVCEAIKVRPTVRNGYHDRPPPCADGSVEGAATCSTDPACQRAPLVQVLWPGQTDGLSPEEFTLAEAKELGVVADVFGPFREALSAAGYHTVACPLLSAPFLSSSRIR